jgi:hypothetical protein
MTCLLDLETRTTTEIFSRPDGLWESVNIPCKRMIAHQMTYCPAWALLSSDRKKLIFPYPAMAYDVKTYYPDCDPIYEPGGPSRIEF